MCRDAYVVFFLLTTFSGRSVCFVQRKFSHFMLSYPFGVFEWHKFPCRLKVENPSFVTIKIRRIALFICRRVSCVMIASRQVALSLFCSLPHATVRAHLNGALILRVVAQFRTSCITRTLPSLVHIYVYWFRLLGRKESGEW